MYSLACPAVQESQQTSWHGSAWKTQPPLAACQYLTHPRAALMQIRSAATAEFRSRPWLKMWGNGLPGKKRGNKKMPLGKTPPRKIAPLDTLPHQSYIGRRLHGCANYTVSCAISDSWVTAWPPKRQSRKRRLPKKMNTVPRCSASFLPLWYSLYLSLSLSHSISMYSSYQSITLLNSISL